MTNKEAIKILGLECDEWDISHCTASDRREAFRMAITALDQLDNNSTKPDNSTATQSNGIESKVKGLNACRVPEDDTISRQAAIDDIETVNPSMVLDVEWVKNWVKVLPSVQPEIIQCAECKWFQCNMRQDGYLPKGVDEFECRHWCGYCDPMDFCSYAERKENR